jgi:hypothetical protein
MKRWQDRAVVFAVIFVILVWGLCLGATLWAMKPSESRKLESYGRFGDVFGSVNALFTGVAIIGLVYTSILQRAQTQAQLAQIEMQKTESSRQMREQFLTARLNVQAAVSQAYTGIYSMFLSDPNNRAGNSTHATLRELAKCAIRIEVLSFEAQQGFEGGAWTSSVEKESIRMYILTVLKQNVAEWAEHETNNARGLTLASVERASQQIAILSEMLSVKYPDIYTHCKNVRDLLTKDRVDPTPAISWCRDAETFFQRGQFPWV